MAYRFSQRSLTSLAGVHPDLVKVAHRAIQITSQDFIVTEGVRTKERMWETWGQGRTVATLASKGVPAKYAQPNKPKVTWLANPLGSNHRAMADGYGHAIDVVPYPVDWNDAKKFHAIAKAMKQAATELGVKISWGGDWTKNRDLPHFELAA